MLLGSSALFVQMGASLPKGGPAGLFLGFVLYGTIMLAVNQCFGKAFSPADKTESVLVGREAKMA